jgi:outer membrane protein assembly factor BamD (BamD/ComL family)
MISAISNNPASWTNISQSTLPHNNVRLRENIGQLGEDLQSGNLSAAQQDFATLQQTGSQSTSPNSTQSNNPITHAFNQLAVDLQSGNVSGAQQAYSNIQQDFQTQGQTGQTGQAEGHVHRHHHGGGASSEASQLFEQLGQELQTGSLSTAQQTYSSLLQDTSFGAAQPQATSSSSLSLSI